MAKLGNLHVKSISLVPLLSWQSILKNGNLIDLDINIVKFIYNQCEMLAQFWKILKKINCKILMCEKSTNGTKSLYKIYLNYVFNIMIL